MKPAKQARAVTGSHEPSPFFALDAAYTIAPGASLEALLTDFSMLHRSAMGALETEDDFTDAQWAGIYMLRQARGIFDEIERRVLADMERAPTVST